ncbi:MAG: PAS domain-containing protein [Deltaproteobacteria bacterium]
MGKLLHALPIPVVLVDHWQHIVFANQSCEKIGGADYRDIVGLPVTELIAAPTDSDKAQSLNARTLSLFEKAFTTRRPQKAEAIIEMKGMRTWCRLHLRAIRVGPVRYILVAVEDLTVEKVQLRLGQRNEQKLMKTHTVLNDLLKERTGKLLATDEQLRAEAAQHAHTAEQLRAERGRFHALCAYVPCGVARVALDGTLLYCNAPFKQVFEGTFVATSDQNPAGRAIEDRVTGREAVVPWLGSMTEETGNVHLPHTLTVRTGGYDGREVRVDAIKLESEYLLICNDAPQADVSKLESPQSAHIEALPAVDHG